MKTYNIILYYIAEPVRLEESRPFPEHRAFMRALQLKTFTFYKCYWTMKYIHRMILLFVHLKHIVTTFYT